MNDAFAGLLLTDSEDEQPQMTSRETRIARAFEQSKKSYASEIVVTPPGWFQIDRIQTQDLTKLDARNVEWSVQRLYLQKAYAAALQLAIEVLHAGGVELHLSTPGASATSIQHDDTGNTPVQDSHGALAKNEARDREMLDLAVRCAIKLGDRETASDLALATRSRWSNSPGLGYTAGEAFMFANRPLDAISALLHAVRARTPSYPVLTLLAQALNATVENAGPHATALKGLADIISQYAERTKPAFEKGLFPATTSASEPELLTSNPKPQPKPKSHVVSETTVRTMGEEAGLGEIDVGLLVGLCCAGDGVGEDVPGAGERSVKSL